ncbi:MAG: sulfotransferase [Candidatus Omnitrophica bacterium]|nr:sulfotransferase [Candidatus Omnitrophota bacterium]
MKTIVFLTYLNRSGSTFLSALLNQYEDIGVSLEAGLPDGILRYPLNIGKKADIGKVLNCLYADKKFSSWNIDRIHLQKLLEESTLPLKFSSLLTMLMKCYFDKRGVTPQIYIYKCGDYINYLPVLRQIFPNSKVIFLIRDGRAVYNSQKKSFSSTTNKLMETNPLRSAYKWRAVINCVKQYCVENWFYCLKYEDLVSNPNETLDRLLDFLKSNKKIFREKENYFSAIPQSQKHLHHNIINFPLSERICAWQNELNLQEIVIYEKYAGKVLREQGYKVCSDEALYNTQRFRCLYYKVDWVLSKIKYEFQAAVCISRFLDGIWAMMCKIKCVLTTLMLKGN